MAVRHHGIRRDAAQVHGPGAQALDGVDEEQDAPAAAGSGEPLQIQAFAAGVLHRADGNGPGTVVAQPVEGGLGVLQGQDASGLTRHRPSRTPTPAFNGAQHDGGPSRHRPDPFSARRGPLDGREFGGGVKVQGAILHPLFPQCLPGDAVGGKFLGDADHIVPGPPVQPLGEDGQALGGVLDQGDVVGGGGPKEVRQTLPQAALGRQPGRIAGSPAPAVFLGEAGHRRDRPPGPGRHGGVVEVADVRRESEFGVHEGAPGLTVGSNSKPGTTQD